MAKINWVRLQRYNYTFPDERGVEASLLVGRDGRGIKIYNVLTPLRQVRAERLFYGFALRAFVLFPVSSDKFTVGISVGM